MSNWYIDSSATGSGTGTNWSNAWTSPSSVVWGSSGVKAGDTLYISGGSVSKTYTTSLTIGASGTSGNYINITNGTDSGHTGTVIFDTARINVSSYKYIHIYGNVLGNFIIQNASNSDAYNASIYGSEGGHLIENMRIINSPSGITFLSSISDATTIKNCDLQHIYGKVGISLRGENDLSVYDKYIISGCSIEGIAQLSPAVGPDLVHVTAGSTIHDNYFTYNVGTTITDEHPDMIQQMGPRYVKIYNNTFDGSVDSCIDVDQYFAGTTKSIINFNIYNNIVKSTKSTRRSYQGFRFYTNYSTDNVTIDGLRIFNNTLVDIENRTIGVMSNGSSFTVTNSFIKNNILYNTQGINIDSCSTYTANDWNVDYNIISAGSEGVTSCIVDGSSYTQSHGSTSAPSFLYYQENSPSVDLRLGSGDSVAKDAGTDLSSYVTVDILSVSRPQGSNWDIGAYEYFVGNVSPSITIQPQSQTIYKGESSEFSVTATGTPTPTYQWYKNGSIINGETSSVFTITNCQLSDSANYYVVVTNSEGNVTSSTVSLTVNDTQSPVQPEFNFNRRPIKRSFFPIQRLFKKRTYKKL